MAGALPRTNVMRILVAEDDRVMARLLTELLRSWKYDIVIAQDGAAAVAAFEGDPSIQLVLLDWMLPGMDGPEVCARLHHFREQRATHLILLTSRADPDDVAAGLDAGADDYMVKPFHAKELRARIAAGARIIALQQGLANKIHELKSMRQHLRTLSGLLPICAYCKSIRDDSNYWHRVEEYVAQHADVRFTHGICPRCFEEASREASAGGA